MHSTNGWSLMEVLLTLALVAICGLLTIPSYVTVFKKMQAESVRTQLLSALMYAQSMAIHSNTLTVVCNSEDQRTCSGTWSNGWVVFSHNQLLQAFLLNTHGGVLFFKSFPIHRETVYFTPSGFPKFQNGSFWYCAAGDRNPKWAIVMNQSGHVASRFPDKNAQIHDGRDHVLTCQGR